MIHDCDDCDECWCHEDDYPTTEEIAEMKLKAYDYESWANL